jgi:hypothetical protein
VVAGQPVQQSTCTETRPSLRAERRAQVASRGGGVAEAATDGDDPSDMRGWVTALAAVGGEVRALELYAAKITILQYASHGQCGPVCCSTDCCSGGRELTLCGNGADAHILARYLATSGSLSLYAAAGLQVRRAGKDKPTHRETRDLHVTCTCMCMCTASYPCVWYRTVIAKQW